MEEKQNYPDVIYHIGPRMIRASETLQVSGVRLAALDKNLGTDLGFIDGQMIFVGEEKILWIHMLFVEPRYRRLGIGSILLNQINKSVFDVYDFKATKIVLVPAPCERINANQYAQVTNITEFLIRMPSLVQFYKKNEFTLSDTLLMEKRLK